MSVVLMLTALALAQDPETSPAPAALPPDAPTPDELLHPSRPPEPAPAPVAPPPADPTPPPPPSAAITTPGIGERTSSDVIVFVRRDGQIFVDDQLLDDDEVRAAFEKFAGGPGRLIFTSDPQVPSGRLIYALDLAKIAGVTELAMAVPTESGAKPFDPLFPGASNAGELGATKLEGMSRREIRKLKPRLGRMPQDPYDNVDYTAYTLEWGESKIGLSGLTTGVAPRLQIGTQPVGDLLGLYNASIKWNAFRERRMAMAFRGTGVVVPLGKMLNKYLGFAGGDAAAAGQAAKNAVARAYYYDLGIKGSLELVDAWSIHGSLSIGQIGASGQFSVDQELPLIPLVGQVIPGINFDLSPRLTATMINFKLGTDYRFNKRDSIVFQAGYLPYARVQLAAKFDVAGQVEQIPDDVDLAISLGGWEMASKPSLTYRTSLAYERSMRHWELRIGAGTGAFPGLWLLDGGLDLSYRFGGQTRKSHKQMRAGWRDNKKAVRHGGGDAIPK